MTTQREHIAIEALRTIAKHDNGEAGHCARDALTQINHVDEVHLREQSGYAKEKTARLQNMAASRLGDVTHNPKNMGAMSPQEIEMGPGSVEKKTINWDDPRANLTPSTPEAYEMPSQHIGRATATREEQEKLDEQHAKNRQAAQEREDQEREKSKHHAEEHDGSQKKDDKNDEGQPKKSHDLKADNLTVDKVGGGLDEKQNTKKK